MACLDSSTTRGAAIVAGAPSVKIHGGSVPTRAEVATIGALSAHVDHDELLAWIGCMPRAPRRVL